MPERKVSLKDIVASIDKALAEFDAATSRKPRTLDDRVERSKKVLRGVRESVEGICLPNFEVPVE